MALIVSATSGNFSAGATWVGGVVPGVGDEAQAANGHTITIDVDTTCDEVSNAGTGIFTLADGVTLTANVTSKSTTNDRPVVQFTAASPAQGFIVGDIASGAARTLTGAVNNNSSGTLTITGNATGGSAGNAYGCNNASAGTLTITGNATGGSGTSAFGCNNASAGTLTITGNVTGGSAGSAYGCNNASAGTLTITGNVTGGTVATAFGAHNNSTGTMTVVGTINASEFNEGVGGANRGQITLLTGPFISSPTFGVNPIGSRAWRWAASLNDQTFITVPTSDLLATRNLVTPDNATNFPAEADVKDGVTYGIGGALTGTFEQSVSPDPVDIAAAVWDRVLTGATHNVPSSAGRRLRQLGDERIIAEGTVQSATTGTITIEDVGTLCVGQTIVVTDQSTGDKQTRFILAFDTGTDTATVDSNWCVVPTAGDEYLLTTVRDPLVTRVDHPTGTVGAEIDEMYLLQGLKTGETLTVTPTSRTAGAISQTIGGDGTTSTTVSRD
jgi:hypothetical protein